jgi:anti-anti-sigma factor
VTTAPPSLHSEMQRNTAAATLLVEGDLEEVSAVDLARACLQAHDAALDLTVDLRGVEFADGTGTKMLATIHRAFERSGHSMRIVNVPACVRREITALQLDRELDLAR